MKIEQLEEIFISKYPTGRIISRRQSHFVPIEFERMIKFICTAILALLYSHLNITVNNIFLFLFFRNIENLNNTLKAFTPASLMRSPCAHFHTRLIS